MKIFQKSLPYEILWFTILFIVSSFLFLYKLELASVFTDEVLYFQSGQAYLGGEYAANLQHPLIGKYIAGIPTLFTERNLFILRLPFAILGVLSCLIVYLIIRQFYGYKWAFLGGILYVLAPFIYSSSRMVMLEAPLYFFWLLFNYFYLRYLTSSKKVFIILSGLCLGLGMATKFNSIILYPFSLIALFLYAKTSGKKVERRQLFDLFSMFFISAGTYLFSYIDLIFKNGLGGLVKVAQVTKDVLLTRNSEGKIHVVGDKVYLKSPWWFYLYYFYRDYSPIQLVVSSCAAFFALFSRSFFVLYWALFLLFNIIFSQALSLKNARYISSMEIPLVFLSVAFLNFLFSRLNKKFSCKIAVTIISLIFLGVIIPRTIYVLNQKTTLYNTLYNYISVKTDNFTNSERTYIYGSIRSSRWTFTKELLSKYVVSRKDFEVMGVEFPVFKYIAFDKTELLKNPQNELMLYIAANPTQYSKTDLGDILVYEKISN